MTHVTDEMIQKIHDAVDTPTYGRAIALMKQGLSNKNLCDSCAKEYADIMHNTTSVTTILLWAAATQRNTRFLFAIHEHVGKLMINTCTNTDDHVLQAYLSLSDEQHKIFSAWREEQYQAWLAANDVPSAETGR